MVGTGAGLLGFALVAAILGGGTVGGIAREKGVFAGVDGGVGGRPTEAFTSSQESAAVSRGLRNIANIQGPSKDVLVCQSCPVCEQSRLCRVKA